MCFDFGIISGPIIAGLTYLGSAGATTGVASGAALSTAAWSGATTTGALLASSAAATIASTAVTAVGQSQAAKAQENANNFNASIAEQQALDAQRRGSMAEAEHRTQSKRIVGALRAEAGSSGVVADTAGGADIFAEAAEYGGRQAAAARISGGREAFGYNTQAVLDRYGSRVASSQLGGRIAGTALSGASKLFESSPWWKTWQRPGTTTIT